MNRFCGYGRISSDIDFKVNGEHQSSRFSVAFNRRSAERKTDFLRFVAFGKQAELINNNFKKGSRIALQATAIQPEKYTDQNGNTRYPNVEFWVDAIDFVETRAEQGNQSAPSIPQAQATAPSTADAGFMQIPDSIPDIDELPFS